MVGGLGEVTADQLVGVLVVFDLVGLRAGPAALAYQRSLADVLATHGCGGPHTTRSRGIARSGRRSPVPGSHPEALGGSLPDLSSSTTDTPPHPSDYECCHHAMTLPSTKP